MRMLHQQNQQQTHIQQQMLVVMKVIPEKTSN